jgi:cobalamin-dependent methionine synthase I
MRWRDFDPVKRLEHALVNSISEFVYLDVEEARSQAEKPLDVIEGPLHQIRPALLKKPLRIHCPLYAW